MVLLAFLMFLILDSRPFLAVTPDDGALNTFFSACLACGSCVLQMDCDVEKVRTLSYTLPLTKMVTFLDEAKKNDLEAEAMLKRLGVPVLEVYCREIKDLH